MPWCPKCKSEYEKGVEYCKQCQVDLVEDLETYVEYVPLTEMDEKTANRFIEYLIYSGIKDYKTEEKDESIQISVDKKELKNASKHLNVFVYNLRQEAEENEKESTEADNTEAQTEYVTSEMLEVDKVKEYKVSAWTYYILGGGILLFDYLNMRGTLNNINPILEGIFLFIGIAFVGLGYVTMKKIPDIEETVTQAQDRVAEMIEWYESNHNFESFYEEKNIDKNQSDEGAIYYEAIDAIKADLTEQFPEIEDMALINKAAEEIYSKL